MIVQLGAPDILYWTTLSSGWESSEHFASKFPRKIEAESLAIQLAAKNPDLIGKLQVKNFYANGLDDYTQEELF